MKKTPGCLGYIWGLYTLPSFLYGDCNKLGGGTSNIFYFCPNCWGNDDHMGWFNHQQPVWRCFNQISERLSMQVHGHHGIMFRVLVAFTVKRTSCWPGDPTGVWRTWVPPMDPRGGWIEWMNEWMGSFLFVQYSAVIWHVIFSNTKNLQCLEFYNKLLPTGFVLPKEFLFWGSYSAPAIQVQIRSNDCLSSSKPLILSPQKMFIFLVLDFRQWIFNGSSWNSTRFFYHDGSTYLHPNVHPPERAGLMIRAY